ncbi:MAG: hypothetical protein O3A01_08715 [bacterium]|nr:hypothetical protein [bacterium]
MDIKKIIRKIGIWIAIIIGGFILGFIMATIIGRYTPERFSATKSKSFEKPIEEVWRVIRNIEGYSDWKPGVKRVEMLGKNSDDYPRWREVYNDDSSTIFEVTNMYEFEIMEVHIDDDTSPIKGAWIYKFSDHKGNGILQIKQFSIIESPYRRFEAKYIHGHHTIITKLLFALSKQFESISDL